MSADLFAEFDDFSKPTPQQSQPPKPKPFTHPPSFTPVPFSVGNNPPTHSTTQPGHQKGQPNQRWGNFPQHDPRNSSSHFAELRNENDDGDEDGWGDFEVAPNPSQPPAPPQPTIKNPTSTSNPMLGRTGIVRAPTIDLITNNLIDLPEPSTFPEKAAPPLWTKNSLGQTKKPTSRAASQRMPKKLTSTDPDVLFDADDFDGEQEEEDDDFGEFETVTSPVQIMSNPISDNFHASPVADEKKPSQLLLGLDLDDSAPSYPQVPRSPSFHDRNPFPGLAVATCTETVKKMTDKPKKSPITAWPTLDRRGSMGSDKTGNVWDAFELPESAKSNSKTTDPNWDWDSVEPARQGTKSTLPVKPTSETLDSSWEWDPIDTKTETQVDPPKNELPPINVPPPSILLSVFPQLFNQANTSLYKPVSGQPFAIKNRILSDPKTVEFLKGYLILATVAARIIAGRKLRWHRDKFLTQGMSISAAGSKGMKLAGVDKVQTAREDRETTDVVSTWKEHVGRLRSAVAAANSAIKNDAEQLKIPEINETMQIQTAKMVPTAPKACIICGLKRNERVSKADYEVEDSFGEWWVDHWGHMACKRFWLQHESALRQR
ncbi:hypothetical protein F4779DRAFT_578883 [Xylariaceae sp. FL0662B]|nr:hypothetical protein F4779DRAFT_578883 [Xylariaceae sp. FL0662B]